jgi:two-component sensor histidine kinase
MVSVPLISRNRVLGGISVYTHERHEFSEDQIALLFTFANDAAIAIENARLYEEMRRALEMKSTLLQELHHRVKNNLQMMASLLRLQVRRTKSQEARQTLGVTHAQIESLGAAHDLLSQQSIGLTTVKEIAKRVSDIAVADLLPREKRIAIEVGGDDVQVVSQNATILALVLNELICNAIVHGLEHRSEGRVTVTAREEGGASLVNVATSDEGGARSPDAATSDEGASTPGSAAGAAAESVSAVRQMVIEVCDDGDGLPAGFALDRDTGLGLSIVQRLVTEQLKGTFQLRPRTDGGTVARVTLKATAPTSAPAT